MKSTINPISFKARIMIMPKVNKTVSKSITKKHLQSNLKYRTNWFVRLLTIIIKPKLSIKIKDPS